MSSCYVNIITQILKKLWYLVYGILIGISLILFLKCDFYFVHNVSYQPVSLMTKKVKKILVISFYQ